MCLLPAERRLVADGHDFSLTVCDLTTIYCRPVPVPVLFLLVLGFGRFASSACVCVCVCCHTRTCRGADRAWSASAARSRHLFVFCVMSGTPKRMRLTCQCGAAGPRSLIGSAGVPGGYGTSASYRKAPTGVARAFCLTLRDEDYTLPVLLCSWLSQSTVTSAAVFIQRAPEPASMFFDKPPRIETDSAA